MLRPGTIIGGKYRLVELIGEGGMGCVWRAEHEALGRSFAVKFVLATQGETAIARFFREAKIAAKIRHGNVVSPTDFGSTEEGMPFLVMELLEGESLATRMSRPPRLSPRELVELTAGALSGLDAVHAAGIVHRDIKPGNIFLVREGDDVVAKILDFGTSRATGGGPTLTGVETITVTGMVVGTPYYMSDEQVRGLKDLDRRTDVYAIGVILYEALTGQLPFDSESLHALMIAIATAEPKPLEELRPDLPADLVAVVKKAMLRNREERFQTARDLRRALLATIGASSADSIPRTMVRSAPPSDTGSLETLRERPEEAPTNPRPVPSPDPPMAPDPLHQAETVQLSPPAPALLRDPASVPETASVGAAASPVTMSDAVTLRRDPRSRSRRSIAAVIGVVVLVCAGVGLAVALRAQPGGTTVPAALTSSPLPPATTVAVRTPLPAAPPRAPSAPGPATVQAPVEREVSVLLRGLPPEAVVRVDGTIVPGPALRLPRDGRPRRIAVAAPGHPEWSVEHTCSADGEYPIDLRPPVAGPRPGAFRKLRPGAVVPGPEANHRPTGGELLGDPGF